LALAGGSVRGCGAAFVTRVCSAGTSESTASSKNRFTFASVSLSKEAFISIFIFPGQIFNVYQYAARGLTGMAKQGFN